jgi:hypothetical protein
MISFLEMKQMRRRQILKPLSLYSEYDGFIIEPSYIKTTFTMTGNNLTMTTLQDLVPMEGAHNAFEDTLPAALEWFRFNPRLGDICAHISLNERRITEGIRERDVGPGMVFRPKDSGRCLRCGTLWTYRAEVYFSSAGHFGQVLQLCVGRRIPNIRNPWDKAWLKHFEGGMKLKETVEWCPVFHLA